MGGQRQDREGNELAAEPGACTAPSYSVWSMPWPSWQGHPACNDNISKPHKAHLKYSSTNAPHHWKDISRPTEEEEWGRETPTPSQCCSSTAQCSLDPQLCTGVPSSAVRNSNAECTDAVSTTTHRCHQELRWQMGILTGQWEEAGTILHNLRLPKLRGEDTVVLPSLTCIVMSLAILGLNSAKAT